VKSSMAFRALSAVFLIALAAFLVSVLHSSISTKTAINKDPEIGLGDG
jgi:hypothetical protein